ncbi:DUF2917 domain-containing protein [Iodobacter sp. LRB]|uniref:DUF2917 domain-containing protein n=1 Tax=unclassified Iodobacter TaxID=235634 RepID=UPI000C0FD52A|nr:DUF2917 domain-containing protein [Iodobacter sp. BJB302]PHV02149.1 hypothetical protein CSQ88_08360 [Iodobacter sp. BJB302]
MQITHLKTAEVFSIRAKSWIHCAAGQLWLSHDGHDVILERGQKWQIDDTDLAVIQALQNSHFMLLANEKLSPAEQNFAFA